MGFLHAHGSDDRLAGRFEATGHVLRQTEKAIHFDDGSGPQWLPKRFVHCENNADGTVMVDMPVWLAKQKGYYV